MATPRKGILGLAASHRQATRWKSLSHRDAGSLRVHPGRDVHRSQLLEEQLGRIGNMHLRDPRLVLARSALERILFQIPARHVSAKNP